METILLIVFYRHIFNLKTDSWKKVFKERKINIEFRSKLINSKTVQQKVGIKIFLNKSLIVTRASQTEPSFQETIPINKWIIIHYSNHSPSVPGIQETSVSSVHVFSMGKKKKVNGGMLEKVWTLDLPLR